MSLDPALQLETEKLVQSWMQHEGTFLRDYLVADVEDPRLNVQSILSRHFIIAHLCGNRFEKLMLHELRFAAAMNWLATLAKREGGAMDNEAVLHALKHGGDNAEGVAIPHFLSQTFRALPAQASGARSIAPRAAEDSEITVPNYIQQFLTRPESASAPDERSSEFNTFLSLWRAVLAAESPPRISVLEPACGSANDYRYLETCGIARLIDYTGFDLCEKNIANAQALFPQARFKTGNVFEIAAPDQSFDLTFVHDLLEHLSLSGLERAVAELCRVTRHGLCVNFFQIEEMPEHIVRPIDDYHVNTLSLAKTEELFRQHGFIVQPLHIGSYLRQRVACPETHNPHAYTFLAFHRVESA